MDGRNFNWDVLKLHFSYREQNEFYKLINIVSCGLNVLYGVPQKGLMEADREVSKVLNAMWKIFHELPSRRDIYIRETGCDIFPLHFARPDELKISPLLHEDFRYGKILSRL